jgi:ubiquinone/menaquinone biosynthesis C-methylase UbiE
MAARPEPDPVHRRLQEWWDADAEVYDRSASHSASHPVEAAAWRAALLRHLPPPPARVLDVGAGTGTMSVLAAQLGFRVTALDLSPQMLERATEKAKEQGLEVRTVVGPAHDPPKGPFDAVMERHLLWTLPDPVRALESWRRVVPEGHVLLYEGTWRPQDPFGRAKTSMAVLVRRILGMSHGHHSEYETELLESLPLARRMSPQAVLETLTEAGFSRARIERLRDIEWARLLFEHPVLGPLESVPRFAVLAHA